MRFSELALDKMVSCSLADLEPCNKHIIVDVLLNGEQLIVVRINIINYHHSLIGGGLIVIRPGSAKSYH